MSRPRRVLMTADPLGGVWQYSLELGAALAAGGTRLVLATMGRHLTAAERAAALAVPGLVLEESSFPLEWMEGRDGAFAPSAAWLLALERRHAPDLVHLNGFGHAVLPFRAPRLVVAHSCVMSWWQAVRGGAPPAEWDGYRARVTAGLAAVDMVLAPSHAMAAALAAQYGPPRRPVRVVPNGRDGAVFTPAAKDPLVLGASRLWDPAKNLGLLDAIAPRLPWPVVLAGSALGPDGQQRAPQHARHAGLLDAAAMRDALAGAAIFAHPARYEPFGLSVLEAALSGCALVLADIPSLVELWADAALFVPPDAPEAWVQVIARLAADPGRRSALGAAARRRGLTYTPQRMHDGVTAAYAALLTRPALAAAS